MSKLLYNKDTIIGKLFCFFSIYFAGLICGARADTALYGLPPARTGKRGRPAKRGAKLSLDSFILPAQKVGGYYIGCQRAMTNLFRDRPVMAYVTATKKDGGGRRLFLGTILPTELSFSCAWYAHAPLNQTDWSPLP